MSYDPGADEVRQLKVRHARALLALPGVVGVGVAHAHEIGQHYLHVYTERADVQIPRQVEGVRTVRKVTYGPIRHLALRGLRHARALAQSQEYNAVALDAFVRPVSGGNSVGAYSALLDEYITGTIGMAFQDPALGSVYILSCNHVLAGISTVQSGGASVGAPLFQPGSYFYGSAGAADDFATLSQWEDIDEVRDNTLDWAIGLVDGGISGDFASPQILGLGTPEGIADPPIGAPVQKVGALSGLTTGSVSDIDATVQVDYGRFTATFDDQIVVDGGGGGGGSQGFAQPGDSGSIVSTTTTDGSLVACGLLFSGTSSLTMANKLTSVQAQIPNLLSLPILDLSGGSTPSLSSSSAVVPAVVALGGSGLLLALLLA